MTCFNNILVPVLGSIMAMVSLGEKLQWFHGLGFVLILAGIVLVYRDRRISNPFKPSSCSY
ncbi:MAG: EamA family transporter [Leptolyngbyaceae cyanobacterium RU_5_1]|nr:EamA family transporter [Leptolyngbyaceae cyanobacterium RU_5_1]